MTANLAAARLAHRAGVPIVLDPAPALGDLPSSTTHLRASVSDLLKLVTVLRANEHEAEALTGIRVTNRQTAQKAAEHLLGKYVSLRAAIISAGKGNLAVWRNDEAPLRSFLSINHQPPTISRLFLPRLPVKAIDATGAGDAFAAAFAVALAEGHPIPTAAPIANAAAALAPTKRGAQEALPKRAVVLGLLRRTQSKERVRGLA